MQAVSERRCTDCGAQVERSAAFCPDCWGDSLVWAAGDELADLKQWAAYLQERRMRYNGSSGDEPGVHCDC
jgi:predicted amidophosphoribosyltransferase